MSQEQHKAESLKRWDDLRAQCWTKFDAMKTRRMTRQALEDWLKSQSPENEASLRGMLNRQYRG